MKEAQINTTKIKLHTHTHEHTPHTQQTSENNTNKR